MKVQDIRVGSLLELEGEWWQVEEIRRHAKTEDDNTVWVVLVGDREPVSMRLDQDASVILKPRQERILLESGKPHRLVPTFLHHSVDEHPGDVIIDLEWDDDELPTVAVRKVPTG